MVTNILGFDFALGDNDAQESYTVFQHRQGQVVARCHAYNGVFVAADTEGSSLWQQKIMGNNQLDDRERLFCLMHAARSIQEHLSPKTVDWNQPLRFRDSFSDEIKVISPLPEQDGHTVFIMIEYNHPAGGKPVADIWGYEADTGRPLNPELRMNPMRRYDIINK